MPTAKDALLATGVTTNIDNGFDDVPLIETVIMIADEVILKVFNEEVAFLQVGNGNNVEFNFTEETAALFTNMNAHTVELLATIARNK